MTHDLFRTLPPVERTLEDPRLAGWCAILSRPLVARVVADTLAAIREEIRQKGLAPEEAVLLRRIDTECGRIASRRIRKVINATGIVLHTNMGRAPLPRSAWDAVATANTGYSNLELDLETGKRGRRNGICPDLLRLLTGCEDALVVNNNAAAVLLVLSALAKGREVIVSRGEQVQIGGGFRIPDILALSGARLVEVGTTNITTLADYTRAITDQTAMVLVVHASNFRIRGFTEKPLLSELAAALPPGVLLAVDQGSGTTTENLSGETRVSTLLKQGAHLVCFSGDKVLGGPQAGIIAGKAELVRALSAHPLLRAFRPGKSVYSLLEQCLVEKLNGATPGFSEKVLAVSRDALARMGRRVLRGVPREAARLVDSEISTGVGSAPDEFSPSLSIEITTGLRAEDALATLRGLPTPIIGIIVEDRVRLSLATMYGEDERVIARAVRTIAGM
jgi:L-seryl-tRNA(Ser) seleniumtransferase